ncbi:cell division protein FtsQ/DivIB [Paenibacillus humicola]|uniref:cell division protein FtsQ/DivIB n=1 Tax=Paenibacillus humicola TaxID=3110540 RepID=UPI00237B41F6|nr:FtsQ-type POTRA domain-containing protein [Paenibacillus humicola]
MQEKVPVLREPVRKRRSGKKLLAVLLLLFIVILSVMFFHSSISKISSVDVEGEQVLSVESIKQAAGVKAGDAFFGISASAIERRVKTLKPVESVEVVKTFPGKIGITVREFPVVAFELSKKGELSAVLSNGVDVPATANLVADKPVLTGWQDNDPVKAQLAKQLAAIPPESLADFSEIIPDPSKSYPDRIKIYTRTRFEVITAASLLPSKIAMLNGVTQQQEPGIVTLLLADKWAPFNNAPSDEESSK